MEYDEEGVKPLFLYSIIGKTPNGPQAKCSLWDFFAVSVSRCRCQAPFVDNCLFAVSGTARGQIHNICPRTKDNGEEMVSFFKNCLLEVNKTLWNVFLRCLTPYR